MATRMSAATLAVTTAVLALVLAACGSGGGGSEADQAPRPSASQPAEPTTETTAVDDGHSHPLEPVKAKPLRAGEKRMTLEMPAAYTPSAPNGIGTDDYRCFLLDPHLAKDAYLTGTFVQPGNAEVVHHVILFAVPPDMVADAEAMDASRSQSGPSAYSARHGISTGAGSSIVSSGWMSALPGA